MRGSAMDSDAVASCLLNLRASHGQIIVVASTELTC
jgi:hypothetical protein